MNRLSIALIACCGVATVAGIAPLASRVLADDMKMPTTAPTTEPSAKAVNTKCPITKEAVDSSVATYTYKDKVIGFCCSDCVKTFKADPEKYMADLK